MSSVVQSTINEGKRIYEDAYYCYQGHSQEARWWTRISLQIGIPTAVVAALAGLTSLSSEASSVTFLGFQSNVAVAVLAFAVAGMSGLSTFLDPKGQAARHEQASAAYLGLSVEARMFYGIDCARIGDTDELQDRLKKLSARLNELNSQTPVISERSQRIIEKRRKLGKYDYEVDKQPGKSTR